MSMYIQHTYFYVYKIYIHSMYPKAGLVEETKGGRKEGRTIVNNNEVHYICVGSRHKETH
jgi:hypothetical protein